MREEEEEQADETKDRDLAEESVQDLSANGVARDAVVARGATSPPLKHRGQDDDQEDLAEEVGRPLAHLLGQQRKASSASHHISSHGPCGGAAEASRRSTARSLAETASVRRCKSW
eukprot:CAMPEP_0195113466 /NCGR_PEP_ID=MMETSP0448-20130528/102582_1 /TAXON_ID=66468 /ORGANISM="Heterocapsa triquestra, Strain CCMP 448" /LENGTH=115 /DNA_ID=CAMNT_0040150409 /DNA_START=208 /DNA_END=552 /DNA_ORIENTATION=-